MRQGTRKFIIAGGAILIAGVLAWVGKLTVEFMNIAIAAVMVFSGANAAEHFAAAWKERKVN